jgi:hypothetical protein
MCLFRGINLFAVLYPLHPLWFTAHYDGPSNTSGFTLHVLEILPEILGPLVNTQILKQVGPESCRIYVIRGASPFRTFLPWCQKSRGPLHPGRVAQGIM